MSVPLFSGFFTWPSLEARLLQWGNALSERRSLLVLVPVPTPADDLWAVFAERLERRGLDPVNVDLRRLEGENAETRQEQLLARALGVTWTPPNCPRTMGHLLRQPNLPPVIGLQGLAELVPAAQQRWMEFAESWSAAAHSAANTGELHSALCFIVQAGAATASLKLPPASLYLDVVHWWGIPSALEVHLYCRSVAERGDDRPAALWREYVLPSLVGADVGLADELRQLSLLDDEHTLWGFLAQEGCRRGWQSSAIIAAALAASPTPVYGARHDVLSLSPLEQQWWAEGMLHYTWEYGVELHPAVLALAQRYDVLRQRLWRGQAALLLPLLDQVRIALCERLTEQHGPVWPLKWGGPLSDEEKAAVRMTPLATQWGYLDHLLAHTPALQREPGIRSLVHRARTLRNSVAHFQPVAFTGFQRFWQELEQHAWLNGGEGPTGQLGGK